MKYIGIHPPLHTYMHTKVRTYIYTFLGSLYENGDDFNVIVATLICLAFAAVLNLLGVTESAGISLGIFGFHMLSITVLLGTVQPYTAYTAYIHHSHDCNYPHLNQPTTQSVAGIVTAIGNMPVHAASGKSMLQYNWEV